MTRRSEGVPGSGSGGLKHLLSGTTWGLFGEGIALPTGLATAIFLTRWLGASDYGFYTLTIGVVVLLQGGLNSLLTRATIKFTSQAEDWAPVGVTVIRLHLVTGCIAAAVVLASAPGIAQLLGEPRLTGFLRVFSGSIPIETLAQAHLNVLIGRSRYRERALARGLYWTARLTLIVSLVALGFGIVGALVGGIAASAASLALSRRWIRPSVLGPSIPYKPILAFAFPLFLAGTAGMLARRLDLIALKAMGATTATAGLYSAAQTLAVIPGILLSALAPLLLSSMNRAYFDGRPDYAKGLGRDFLRGGLWIFPLAGMIAGVSSEITLLAYGPEFAPAGPVLSVLFFAGTSSLMGTTCHAVLMVTDKTRAILWISVVPLVVALGLYPFLIPRFGPLGAAASTLSGAGAGLTLALLMVWKLWRLAPPPGTAVRAATVTVGAFWLASSWETSSVWLLPKLLSVTLLIPVAFLTLGEFKGTEIRAAVRFLRKGIGDVGRPFNRDRIE